MKIAICDDDKNVTDYLQKKIESFGEADTIEIFNDSSQMMPDRMAKLDLIFLDIEMPGMDGMELVYLLRARQEDSLVNPFGSLPLIVFVTGYKEYMLKAFSVHAFDYMLKPVSEGEIRETYNRAKKFMDTFNKKDTALTIKNAGKTYTILLSDIKFIESQNRKNIIWQSNGNSIAYYGSMDELEKELDSNFFRIHRGYIVNMRYIQRYDRNSVTVGDNEVLMLSKYRYPDFVEAYMNFIRGREYTL